MLPSNKLQGPRPKCYFTSSTLPAFVDHEQLPLKKKPFSTILYQIWNHTLQILVPKASARELEKLLDNDVGTLSYSAVYMKLGDLIEGDFFNRYIKTGNVLMLSEGRPGIDHVFSLVDGILRLEVDRPTFERMGLEGKSIATAGRKHVKARYAIELNLRLPSMVRGKSGFQRIVWAFRNVLNQSLKWLFYDLKRPNDGSGPISIHQPVVKEVKPEITELPSVEVPHFGDCFEEEDYETATDLLEWLTLSMCSSPRVQKHDKIDQYLSRYRVPQSNHEAQETSQSRAQDLVSFQYHGLIPRSFIQSILLIAMRATGEGWFAISAGGFDGSAYTFLQRKDSTLTWEYDT